MKIDPPTENFESTPIEIELPPEENFYLAAVSRVNGIGSKKLKQLLDFFDSPRDIWQAETIDLKQAELPQTQIDAFIEYREKFPHAPEKMFEVCQQKNIKLISIRDALYPKILAEIKNPPTLLFYYGNFLSDAERLAVVGTRNPSQYGQQAAIEISETVARANFTVVSGAAAGIDTVAHQHALKFGRTVAVLGCGINYVYPRENRRLLEEIAENGAVISEYAPYTPSAVGLFPARNRIISGLSMGTIVIEGSENSGAIITADLAREQNRDIFAVPGNIFEPRSKGCHRLIQRGAIIISEPRDVVDFYNGTLKLDGTVKIARAGKISSEENIPSENVELSDDEQKIYDILTEKPVPPDIIIYKTEIPTQNVLMSLTNLEVQGLIERNDVGQYFRKSVDRKSVDNRKNVELSDDERKIYDILTEKPIPIDIIIDKTGISVQNISSLLFNLEMQGLIEKNDVSQYSRKH